MKYPDLLIEVTKWTKSKLEGRIKCFCYYFAPGALKGDVSSNVSYSYEEFHRINRASFIGHGQQALDSARNFNYQPEVWRNNYNPRQAWQRDQNRSRNNYGGNQRNQGYHRQGRDRGANNNEATCAQHISGSGRRQPDVTTKTRAHLVKDQPKNDFPSSGQ